MAAAKQQMNLPVIGGLDLNAVQGQFNDWLSKQPPAVEVLVTGLTSSVQGVFLGYVFGSISAMEGPETPGMEKPAALKAMTGGGPLAQVRHWHDFSCMEYCTAFRLCCCGPADAVLATFSATMCAALPALSQSLGRTAGIAQQALMNAMHHLPAHTSAPASPACDTNSSATILPTVNARRLPLLLIATGTQPGCHDGCQRRSQPGHQESTPGQGRRLDSVSETSIL